MSSFLSIIAATSLVSLFSLGGILALSLKENTLHRILLFVVAFSAGSILGAAYFDLLPEAMELVDESVVFVYVTLGFVLFFFLERFIYWYHGHGHEADIAVKASEGAPAKAFAYLNLIGDGIHNIIDGMVIAASFLIGL
ncbi:MAG: ZIP family metal transporter, partial [Candidatus Bathyarchaeota archaeon]|nr:ZIP family metal transporter [Candidatus Bathyarchaeota archaeon]